MNDGLFSELRLRDLRFKNRIFVSPMCQYSAQDGVPNDWHLVHLGSRAVGGAALVMAEATAVTPDGRISTEDTGLWNDTQAEAFARIARFIQENGAVPGIQLAHAGRKGGAGLPIGPSPIAFSTDYSTPREMTEDDLGATLEAFVTAARRAKAAGFQVVEVHMAHGYLLHEFLSPISNKRTDQYGGELKNRTRFPVAVARAVRGVWPAEWPVFTRVSGTDWVEEGWDIPQTVALARELREAGIDLVDCSSGGSVPGANIPVGPGYQVPIAEAVRREAGVPSGAVGLITEAEQADEIIRSGKADAILIAREFLRDPYWPLHAAHKLGVDVPWPRQYDRAKPR